MGGVPRGADKVRIFFIMPYTEAPGNQNVAESN
jgi:hypothetical protein